MLPSKIAEAGDKTIAAFDNAGEVAGGEFQPGDLVMMTDAKLGKSKIDE